MRSLVLREPRRIEPADRAEPEVGAGFALVRVRSIGICGSDLHAYRGHHPYVSYPRVLGHELGGEVLEARGNHQGIGVGDRVCVEPILNCGSCLPCREGRYNCCTKILVFGIHTDGGMTERIAVPIDRLHKPSIDLSFDELALCETLSIGVQAVKRAAVRPGESVVILGAGPIGLGALIAARAEGASTIVSDPLPTNRDAARAMGADHVIDPTAGDLVQRVQDLTAGEGGARVVLEAVGKPETIAQTIELAAPTGRIVIIGVCKKRVPIPIADLMRKEVDLFTTRNSSAAFPKVLELFQRFRQPLSSMLTHRFAFEEAPGVFAWLDESRGGSGVIKAVLRLD